MQQGSPEWKAARVGKVTASRIADVLAKTKTGPSTSRTNYLAELVAERLTGEPVERGFTSAAMQWGTETEAVARDAYAFMVDAEVAECGLFDHPRIGFAAASPDGLVGDDGLLEAKCPNSSTHIDTLLGETIPAKYRHQMLWQMACTGRKWCDFVSFDPRLPQEMRLFIARFYRDDIAIAEVEREVAAFLTEVHDTVERLRDRYIAPAPSTVLAAG